MVMLVWVGPMGESHLVMLACMVPVGETRLVMLSWGTDHSYV